jgi:hypothetical protein
VALDHRVEELGRGGALRRRGLGIVEVSAGLGDDTGGVVVQVLVLVAGDDVPGREGLDGADGVAPCVQAASGRLPEEDVGAVVEGIAGGVRDPPGPQPARQGYAGGGGPGLRTTGRYRWIVVRGFGPER